MNLGYRADSLGRWWRGKLSWRATLLCVIVMLALSWMFSSPGPYYMGIILVLIAACVLLTSLMVWPPPTDATEPLRIRRLILICFVLLSCASIWFLQLPLRLRFALSMPSMNRALKTMQQNRTPLPTRQTIGLYAIGEVVPPRYDTVWRFYEPGGKETGFAFSATPVNYAGSNAGAGGHLFGGWYWFSDD